MAEQSVADESDRLKMICVFSMEAIAAMKGSRGKLAAQAGHAYLHASWDAMVRFPVAMSNYRRSLKAFKICLSVATDAELRDLERSYADVCGVSLVTDAGITVFEGPTTTCIGIGPILDSQCKDDLKSLKVLT